MKLKERFKSNPTLYYAMCIAASWAGGASMIAGHEMAHNYGIVPFLIWALGNSLACVFFGIFAPRIPKLREVMRSKPLKLFMGILCVLQIWLNMNGVQTNLAGHPWISHGIATAISITIAAVFIAILWRNGMIRNVLTDHVGWCIVYGMIAVLTLLAFISSGGEYNNLAMAADKGNVLSAIQKAILFLPGGFTIPLFWDMLDYNFENADGVKPCNIQNSFYLGGGMFALYLVFVFFLAWVDFSSNPILHLIKVILIAIIASSTVSTFLFGVNTIFGKKIGTAINVATIAGWQFLIPLGVMGAWTLAAGSRAYVVVGSIAVALVWFIIEKAKEKRMSK